MYYGYDGKPFGGPISQEYLVELELKWDRITAIRLVTYPDLQPMEPKNPSLSSYIGTRVPQSWCCVDHLTVYFIDEGL